jgi:hypothetical protein
MVASFGAAGLGNADPRSHQKRRRSGPGAFWLHSRRAAASFNDEQFIGAPSVTGSEEPPMNCDDE